ncbi:MAG TPA: hypothetical protein VFM02_00355 [Candidatus Paceibacterota bacterium]|nr:hypothetical protein [Candidatus Paceibacterota bacterium]
MEDENKDKAENGEKDSRSNQAGGRESETENASTSDIKESTSSTSSKNTPAAFPKEKLLSFTTLFKNAFREYLQGILVYLGIYLLGIAGMIVIGILLFVLAYGIVYASGSGLVITQMIIPLVLVLLIICVSVWMKTALYTAVIGRTERMGILAAYRESSRKAPGFLLIMILAFLVIFAGFVLFVVPGIFLEICFLFIAYTYLAEGERGLNVFVKSREYVRGYWWAIFGRILAFAIVFCAVLGIWDLIFFFLGGKEAARVANTIFVVVGSPFILTYTFHLFQDIKRLKGSVSVEGKKTQKRVYVGLGVLAVLFLIGLVFLINALAAHEQQHRKIYDTNGKELPISASANQQMPPTPPAAPGIPEGAPKTT